MSFYHRRVYCSSVCRQSSGFARRFPTTTRNMVTILLVAAFSLLSCEQPVGGPNVPPVPTGLTASNDASQFRIDLAWNESAGAEVYVVARAPSSTGAYTELGTSTTTSFTDTNVSPGETWYYTVRAAADLASERSAPSAFAAGGTRATVSVEDIRTLGITGRVQLQGVVVTAVGDRDFAVHDPSGGQHRGMYVWIGGSFGTLSVGNTIGIDAYVGTYVDNLQLEAGPSPIQIVVESLGSTSPDPVQLAAKHSDWELYEGSLVTISGTTLSVGTPDQFGVATINVTGLELDDTFYEYSSGSYSSITGIVFDGYGGYQLLPRGAADMVAE